MNKVIFLFFIFLIPTASIYSQQVWPVQVTGSIIPPHSLDLKVYGNDRSTDLNFQVLLNDPEELALQVIPILTIEQNGNVIYQTDMNYSANPITLNQFSSYLLDGAALNQYLSAEALSGNNGIGKGATLIPEGFTQICLQMYGVDRTVPVSNKFCVSGNFRLNQAPQLIKPSFNDIIKMPPVQNMIFSWMPMHLSSGNNPGAVEYVFELVELPTGVMNANDVFESALKIYSTTVMSTSFIYSQSEPVLNPNTYYAWRITAKSILYPTSLLFQNEGKSEISMFMMYDGDAPSTVLNPFDNPAPRGCSVYETSYGPIAKADNESMMLGANQEVKLGFFKMKITEAIGDIQNGYSGKGIVYYPMLRSSLELEFKNVKVNKEGRVYVAEKINAQTSPELDIPIDQIDENKIKKYITNEFADLVYSKITDQSIVAKLPESNSKINDLPLALSNEKFPDELSCVTGIYFTPTNAYLNLISKNKNGDIYAATGIQTTPYGVKSDAHLVPIIISTKTERSDKITESIYFGGLASEGSKIFCDCKGYSSVKAKSALSISPEIIHEVNKILPITLISEKTITNLNTHIGKVKLNADFEINGLPGFTFSSKNAWLDLDQTQQLNIKIPPASKLNNPTGRGIVIEDLAVKIPKDYNFISPATDLELDKGNIVINEEKLESGIMYKTDVLSLKEGKIGTWAYSIDSLILKINSEKKPELQFNGDMKAPFFEDKFAYRAQFEDRKYNFKKIHAIVNQSKLNMAMWKAEFNSKENSMLEANLIQQDNGVLLSPKCSFDGDLNIKLTDQQFRDAIINQNKGITIDELKKALKIESLSFDLSNLRIEGLSSDPFKEMGKRYAINKLDKKAAKLIIGKEENKLTDASFQYEVNGNTERLGLKIILVKGQSKVELIIWSKSKNNEFEFEGIEVKTIDQKCNCSAMNVIPTENEWNEIIRNYYNHKMSANKSIPLNTSGLLNYNKQIDLAYIEELEMIGIKQNAISWFPASVDESVIYIPFLNKYLQIEKDGNEYKGKYSNPKFGKPNIPWDYKLFDQLENASNDTINLPLVISEDLWSQFGFKSAYALPNNFKLYISEFKSSSNKLENASIKINLVGLLEIDGRSKFIEFSSLIDIPIGPTKVSLKDIMLHLIQDTKLNDNIIFLTTIKDGIADLSTETGSFARLSCEEGLSNFNLQGNFVSSIWTISDISNIKEPTSPINLGFKLTEDRIENNNSLLTDFIAPIKSTRKVDGEWKPWKFASSEDQHIVFTPGNTFEAYLDFSPTRSEAASTNSKNYMNQFHMEWMNSEGFTGILFKSMQMDIPILERKRTIDNSTIEFFMDTIYNAYYDLSGSNFFASYQAINEIPVSNNARLGGWRYKVDTLSFNIENSLLDENKLILKGNVKLPLVKDAPEKDSEKWLENYNDPWVPFKLGVEYNRYDKAPNILGFVDSIETRIFESAHIDNLGFKLEKESNVEFYYDKIAKKLKGRAKLNGRGIYTIKKLDAKIPVFKFQDINLNYSNSGLCKGDGMDGIESIDFGTWGISPFSPQEIAAVKAAAETKTGQNLISKGKENKYAKSLGSKFDGLSKLAAFEINIHQPKFTCTGKEYKLIVGLDVSIMRDKDNLTEAQQKAYDQFNPLEAAERNKTNEDKALKPIEEEYRNAQKNIQTIANEKKALLEERNQIQKEGKKLLKKFDKNTQAGRKKEASKIINSDATTAVLDRFNNINKKIEELNKKYQESLKQVKEKYKPFKEQKTKIKSAENELDAQTKASIAKNAKNNTLSGRAENFKADFKSKLSEAKATKTGAFSAGGDIEVSFTNQGFKDVALGCLALGGDFGPISFKGGINLFRDETTASTFDPNAVQSAWGNGFLGMIELKVLDLKFKTKFQTGSKFDKPDPNNTAEEFRYWFADLSLKSSQGIPLDNAKQFSLTGIGGGAYYNMATEKPNFDDVKQETPKANNDHCQVAGLKAGESLSGLQYKVAKGYFGGYVAAEISHTARVSLENIIGIEMSYIKGELKFVNLGINVNGYALYTDYFTKETSSPVIIKGNVNLNFEQNVKVYGGIDFRLGKEAGPLSIAAPSDKNSNPNSWNQIKFLFSGKDNYVHAGSWGAPNNLDFYRSNVRPASNLNLLSAGIKADLFGEVFAGLYFQGGTKIDGFPTINTFLPEYKGKIVPNPTDVSSSGTSSGAIAGFLLNAKMKGGFLLVSYDANGILGANLSVSKINKSNSCNTDGSAIGFAGGYYARGNVFASIKANAFLDVNMLVYSGKYSIFDSKMDFVMDFGFPNPGYLQGEFSFSYSILGGLKEGNETIEFDAGNKPCVIRENNPTTGIMIHKNLLPRDGATNIKNLDTIQVETRLPYLKEFCIEKTSEQTGKLPSEYLRYRIQSFVLRAKNSKKIIKTSLVAHENENNYQVVLNEKLSPETTYEIDYNYTWEISKDGKQTYSVISGQDEKGITEFTTAEADAVISKDLLEYAMPGHRQRYWNNDYGIPCLKFKKDISQEKLQKIFPNDKLYLYFAIIKEHKMDGSVTIHKIPIENIPTVDDQAGENMDGSADQYNSYSSTRYNYLQAFFKDTFQFYSGNKAFFKTYNRTFDQEDALTKNGYLTFSKLNKLPFSKGSLCNMVIYRAVPKDKNPEDINGLIEQYSDETTRNQIPIYENSFGVSLYPNLMEKMKDIVISFGATKASITSSKRFLGNIDDQRFDVSSGFNRDEMEAVIDRSIADSLDIVPRNAYLGINGSKEGIDLFDMEYLNYFSVLSRVDNLSFIDWIEDKKTNQRKSVYDVNSSIGKSREHEFYYSFMDNGYKNNGLPIDYTYFSNHQGINKYEITTEEIESGKLQNVTLGTNYENGFIYDESSDFDIYLEDGFQSILMLKYLLIKQKMEENGNGSFSEFPEDDVPLWLSYDWMDKTDFKINWQGKSYDFNWADYNTRALYLNVETGRGRKKFNGWKESFLPEENKFLLPINRNKVK